MNDPCENPTRRSGNVSSAGKEPETIVRDEGGLWRGIGNADSSRHPEVRVLPEIRPLQAVVPCLIPLESRRMRHLSSEVAR